MALSKQILIWTHLRTVQVGSLCWTKKQTLVDENHHADPFVGQFVLNHTLTSNKQYQKKIIDQKPPVGESSRKLGVATVYCDTKLHVKKTTCFCFCRSFQWHLDLLDMHSYRLLLTIIKMSVGYFPPAIKMKLSSCVSWNKPHQWKKSTNPSTNGWLLRVLCSTCLNCHLPTRSAWTTRSAWWYQCRYPPCCDSFLVDDACLKSNKPNWASKIRFP